jgi:hypothetical protein
MNRHLRSAAGLLALLVPISATRADVTLIGVGKIPGSLTDKSGVSGTLTNVLGETIAADQFGSFGSGLTYSGAGNRYYATNDRGFGDGMTRSLDRFHVLEITVDPAAKTVTPRLVETRMLTDESGRNFIGLSSAYDQRFDPEGIRVGRDGTLYISDEYGPYVWQFTPEGKRLRMLAVPDKFQIAHPDPDEDREIAGNTSGRVSNKGMEGLAITPDGRALFGIMQSPLIQDGGRKSVNNRILKIDLANGSTREYLYPLENPKTGVSEILAIDDHRFIVLERDGKGGKSAFSKLFAIDVAKASDISAIGTTAKNGLPTSGAPAGVTPVAKRLFLDLLDPKFGLASDDYPAKVEGLTWGPDLPDGRRLLLVMSDNDLMTKAPTWIYAFAIDRDSL